SLMLLIPATSQTRTAALRVTARAWNSYLLRRVVRALLTVLAVSTLTFLLVRLMPGNPVDVFIHDQITTYGQTYEQALEQARGLFALDLKVPLPMQYVQYLGNLVLGIALVLSFVLGVVLGMQTRVINIAAIFLSNRKISSCAKLGTTGTSVLAYQRDDGVTSGILRSVARGA
ncbi:MAG: hypothetical protein ACREJ4_10765, partial [Candidatus Methylomirabilaceae bacterium]